MKLRRAGARWRTRLTLALAGFALAGCASGTVAQLPAPPTTMAPVSTSSTFELGGGYLDAVSGLTTTTSTPLGPGLSGLNGTVTGPNGPVAGAVVQVQRLARPGSSPVTDRLSTAADGTWSLVGILGGVYRLRAWRSPDLSMTQAVTFFLSDGATRQVPMQLGAYTGQSISASMAPDPPVVGNPVNLVVEVTNTMVDANGIVRAQPVAGASVQLSTTDQWTVDTANPTTTAPDGQASWELTCEASGSQSLSVAVNGAAPVVLSPLSACVSPSAQTTTTTTRASSTTTTR